MSEVEELRRQLADERRLNHELRCCQQLNEAELRRADTLIGKELKENTRLVGEVERIRGLTAEARAWCGRHEPGCKAQEAARGESPFFTATVDDARCTCYVLPLYQFEAGAASDKNTNRQPTPEQQAKIDALAEALEALLDRLTDGREEVTVSMMDEWADEIRSAIKLARLLPAVHFRDPANNERSVCNAEERAVYCGDEIVATRDPREVTCGLCLRGIPKSINPRPADVTTPVQPAHYVVIPFYTAEDAARFINAHASLPSGRVLNGARLLKASELKIEVEP